MTISKFTRTNFDEYITLLETNAHDAAIASNEAFVLAMARAVSRGREKVKPGTFIDHTPAIGARRMHGTFPLSACGSPAAMCAERGASPAGAQTLR
jgi:hypothetical protein